MPDLRGTFLRGVDAGRGEDSNAGTRTASNTGGNTGDKVGTKQGDEFKAHNHNVTDNGHTHPYNDIYYSEGSSFNPAGSTTVLVPGDVGSGDTDNNNVGLQIGRTTSSGTTGISIQNRGGAETRPKNVSVLYIIKY